MEPTKKQIQQYAKHMLATNKEWALKCLEVVYKNQPIDETGDCLENRMQLHGDDYLNDDQVGVSFKRDKPTYKDSEGFNKMDFEILVSIYKQLRDKKYVSPKQMAIVFKRIPKYWKQFIAKANTDKLKVQTVQYFEKINL